MFSSFANQLWVTLPAFVIKFVNVYKLTRLLVNDINGQLPPLAFACGQPETQCTP